MYTGVARIIIKITAVVGADRKNNEAHALMGMHSSTSTAITSTSTHYSLTN